MIACQGSPVFSLLRSISIFTSGIKTLSAHWLYNGLWTFRLACTEIKIWIWKSLDGIYALYSLLQAPPLLITTPLIYVTCLVPQSTGVWDHWRRSILSKQFTSTFDLRKLYISIGQFLLKTFSHPQPQWI